MSPELSRNFTRLLNSLEPRARFEMQSEFALSGDQVKYARSAIFRHSGKFENA
jgi:hypothetical protein